MFNPETLRKHNDYLSADYPLCFDCKSVFFSLILQSYPVSPGLLFIYRSARAEEFNPTLKFGKGCYIEMWLILKMIFGRASKKILSDIFNKELPSAQL